jgi:hypothetical protein
MDSPRRPLGFGAPEPQRSRRFIVALICYSDESEQDGVLVYAGYIARIADWEKLIPAWQALLDAEPKLEYFKMKEAWQMNEQWKRYRWGPFDIQQRDARLCDFYKVISAHILGGISIVLPVAEFEAAFASRPDTRQQMKNKHFFIIHNVMHDLLRFMQVLGLDEPIDFIFDDQTRGKTKIFEAWDSFRNHAPCPNHRFGRSPDFQNDKDTIPLQAADFFAWVIRRNAMRFLKREPEETFPWSSLPATYKRINRVWDTEELLKQGRRKRTNGP